MKLTKLEFQKKLQSLADQGALLSRICQTRTLDETLKVITEEADRVKAESAQLQREAIEAEII